MRFVRYASLGLLLLVGLEYDPILFKELSAPSVRDSANAQKNRRTQ
jgi:hypothetical protein